jgi:hypothetical protein
VHFALVILEMRSHEPFALSALNLDPPGLSLPSSQDYKCEPLTPGQLFLYVNTDSWTVILYFGLQFNSTLLVAKVVPVLAVQAPSIAPEFL